MKKIRKLLLYALGGILGVWLTAKLLLPIGLPFLLGWGISRLSLPLERQLKKRLPFASFLSVTAVAAAIGGIVWLLGRGLFVGLERLGERLPALLTSLSEPMRGLEASLLRLAGRLPDGLSAPAVQWLDRLFAGSSVIAGRLSDWVLSLAGRILMSVPDILLFALTLLLSAYLFSSERGKLQAFLDRHIPEHWRVRGRNILKKLRTALGAYLKTQLRLSLVILGLTAAGLLILGLRSALPTALLIAAVDALPVFGAGTVLIPWGVISFLRGNTVLGVGLLVLYALCSVSRAFLEPRFLGKQIGLNPLVTLAALYAGYRLFGILGMILLPFAVILLKQLYELIESA